jgi:Meiotically Up-regulated Gene 113 (MUG113) protein
MENLLAVATKEREHGASFADLARSWQCTPRTEVVYYIQFDDRVKIGTTAHIHDRLGQLPYDRLLGLEPGGYDVERRRHDQFRLCRIRGEWFAASEELLQHAASCRREHPELLGGFDGQPRVGRPLDR